MKTVPSIAQATNGDSVIKTSMVTTFVPKNLALHRKLDLFHLVPIVLFSTQDHQIMCKPLRMNSELSQIISITAVTLATKAPKLHLVIHLLLLGTTPPTTLTVINISSSPSTLTIQMKMITYLKAQSLLNPYMKKG